MRDIDRYLNVWYLDTPKKFATSHKFGSVAETCVWNGRIESRFIPSLFSGTIE